MGEPREDKAAEAARQAEEAADRAERAAERIEKSAEADDAAVIYDIDKGGEGAGEGPAS